MDHVSPGARSELSRIGFLDNELELCKTFLDLAFIDGDDPAAALAARSKAQEGYDVVLTWIASIHSTTERDRLMNKLFDLRKRLDDFDLLRPTRKPSTSRE